MLVHEAKVRKQYALWKVFTDSIVTGTDDARTRIFVEEFLDVKCDHEYQIVTHVLSNGTVTYRNQCRLCGDVSGNSIAHSKLSNDQRDKAPARLSVDYKVIRDLQHETRTKIYDRLKERQTAGFWAEYSRYLQSPAWAARRLKVFTRAGWMCEGCGIEKATEIHHLTYTHVYNEFLFELVALCHECHARLTAEKQARP